MLSEKDITIEYLKSKIKLKSIEEKNNYHTEPKSNAFSIEIKGKCYSYGKPGHKLIDCTKIRAAKPVVANQEGTEEATTEAIA